MPAGAHLSVAERSRLYAFAMEMRNNPPPDETAWSWSKIGASLGKSRQAIQASVAVHERYLEEQGKDPNRNEDHRGYRDSYDRYDLPDYGKLKPTMYTTEISMDPWVALYCEGHTWLGIDYLQESRDNLWTRLRLLTLLSRNFGKTWNWTEVSPRWMAEKRTPQIAITAGAGRSEFMHEMVESIVTSPRFRMDYGDIVGKFTLSPAFKMKLREPLAPRADKQASLWLANRGNKNVIGSHPAWLHLEDIIQEPFRSGESHVRLLNWWGRVILGMRGYAKGNKTKITVTGTRNSPYDFYQTVIDSKQFPKIHRLAIENVGSGPWPTWADVEKDEDGFNIIPRKNWKTEYKYLDCPNWPPEHLLFYRLDEPHNFALNIQNTPLPDSGEIFKQPFHVITPPERNRYTEWFSVTDPAYGSSPGAAFCATVVFGVHDWGYLDIWDGNYTKGNSNTSIAEILSGFKAQWKLDNVYVHADRSEWYLFQALEDLCDFQLTDIQQQLNKQFRIASLESFINSGRIRIVEGCSISTDIDRERLLFDGTKADAKKKDDALDAITTAKILYKHVVDMGDHGGRKHEELDDRYTHGKRYGSTRFPSTSGQRRRPIRSL